MSLPKGYLDADSLDIFSKLLNSIKQRSYDAMHIQPGHKLLDLGCGPGTDTIPLGLLVGNQGQVIGADYDLAMLAEANGRAAQAGVSAWVSHQQADAASLPFDNGYFDACRSDRLFQHLPDPAQTLSEMARVTKSGGWIVAMDTDWGSLSIDADEIDIERRYARFVASSALHNGYSGRTLFRHFKRQGLTDISFQAFPITANRSLLIRQATQADRTEQEAITAGTLSIEEVRRWRGYQEQADTEGVFFASVNIMLVAGRKP